MKPVKPGFPLCDVHSLPISVKANVRAANVMPELKQTAHARVASAWDDMNRTIMIMAGETGGHSFGFGRVPGGQAAARLTSTGCRLACTEDVAAYLEAIG